MIRDKLQKKLFVLAVCLIGGIAVWMSNGQTALAAPNDFIIEAENATSDKETKTLQLTITNQGEDWEGTVRVKRKNDYYYYGSDVAYDTKISLPRGSVKQFAVKIPIQKYDDSDGTVRVTLLDKKKREVTYREFKQILAGEADFLDMGILSDAYDELTYLDMGGASISYGQQPYPVRLTQVDDTALQDDLDALKILVIDRYNTKLFSSEQLQAINDWVRDGGVLVVGTGEYADDTLNGMSSILELVCSDIYNPVPGEQAQAGGGQESSNDATGDDAANNGTIGDDTTYGGLTHDEKKALVPDGYIGVDQLHFAFLDDPRGLYDQADYRSMGLGRPWGYGAIMVLPYSLSELGKMGTDFYNAADYYASDQETFVRIILETAIHNASIPYSSTSSNYYDSNMRSISRIMNFWGGKSSRLNFGLLKVIIVLYVIFVGPILYLILMAVKKREIYWIAAPVTAFFGIMLIFLAGRGFEVVDTTVFSVTAKNLSDRGKETSYMYCYDADHTEWALRLTAGYDYVGAIEQDSYRVTDDENSYYYHVCREGERFTFGVKPSKGFEDTYFYAGKGADADCEDQIDISGLLTSYIGAGVYGEIVNRTGKDFDYFAVVADEKVYVYDGLKAGETCDLSARQPVFDSSQSYGQVYSEYMYDFLDDSGTSKRRSTKESGLLSALGIGICSAYTGEDPDAVVVVGVTDDWEDVVDDRCKEASYGCLYAIK